MHMLGRLRQMVEDDVLVVVASDTSIAVLHLLSIEARADSRQTLHGKVGVKVL